MTERPGPVPVYRPKVLCFLSLEDRIRRSLKARKASAARQDPDVKTGKGFAFEALAVFRKSKGLRLRAGTWDHRFIDIWFVLVKDRLFVRSWSVKANGWYRTFLVEPRGTIQLGNFTIAVSAVQVRSEHLRDAVDRAYLDKYNTPGALKYARDLAQARSRATTTELLPL
jgi:hypothetical protein